MGSLYLAWRYILASYRKIIILVSAITLVLWLPLAIQLLVDRTSEQLQVRAQQTPLVIGAPGSPLELTLSSLYFRGKTPPLMGMDALQRVTETAHSEAIPLYVRFNVQGFPVVGTSLAYFEFRGLEVIQGRFMAVLGEAVLGANVARKLGVSAGEHIISSPENMFDIAGVYPLKMPIAGVLAPTFGPDDEAVFVDTKTSWIIQGLGHGHQDLNKVNANSKILKAKKNHLVANASVVQYNEITASNMESFHFHGDQSLYPITAVLPATRLQKNQSLLLGDYAETPQTAQIVRSPQVVGDLMDTLFQVRSYLVGGMLLISIATSLVAILVFILSFKLRSAERNTLENIGASRLQITSLMAAELVTVLLISLLLASLLLQFTELYGVDLLQQYILG